MNNAGQMMAGNPNGNGIPGDPPMDDLTFDLQCFGLRSVLESIVGVDQLRTLYTLFILFVACLVGYASRVSKKMAMSKRCQDLIRYALIIVSFLCFISFCSVLVGYGMGYTTGYGERISTEELNAYQSALTSMVMRVFWSFLLSCGIAFIYSYTSQCLPCCPAC